VKASNNKKSINFTQNTTKMSKNAAVQVHLRDTQHFIFCDNTYTYITAPLQTIKAATLDGTGKHNP